MFFFLPVILSVKISLYLPILLLPEIFSAAEVFNQSSSFILNFYFLQCKWKIKCSESNVFPRQDCRKRRNTFPFFFFKDSKYSVISRIPCRNPESRPQFWRHKTLHFNIYFSYTTDLANLFWSHNENIHTTKKHLSCPCGK